MAILKKQEQQEDGGETKLLLRPKNKHDNKQQQQTEDDETRFLLPRNGHRKNQKPRFTCLRKLEKKLKEVAGHHKQQQQQQQAAESLNEHPHDILVCKHGLHGNKDNKQQQLLLLQAEGDETTFLLPREGHDNQKPRFTCLKKLAKKLKEAAGHHKLQQHAPMNEHHYERLVSKPTLVLDWETIVKSVIKERITLRLGITAFVKAMAEHYEIFVFTPAHQQHAKLVLGKLDPHGELIHVHAVCQGQDYWNELSRLDRDLQRVVIMDAHSACNGVERVLLVSVLFRNMLRHAQFRKLAEVTEFLSERAHEEDVRLAKTHRPRTEKTRIALFLRGLKPV